MKVHIDKLDPRDLCERSCRKRFFDKSGWLQVTKSTDPLLALCQHCADPHVKAAEKAEELRKRREAERAVLNIRDRFLEATMDLGRALKLMDRTGGKLPVGLILPNGNVIPIDLDIMVEREHVEYRRTGGAYGTIPGRANFVRLRIPPTTLAVNPNDIFTGNRGLY